MKLQILVFSFLSATSAQAVPFNTSVPELEALYANSSTRDVSDLGTVAKVGICKFEAGGKALINAGLLVGHKQCDGGGCYVRFALFTTNPYGTGHPVDDTKPEIDPSYRHHVEELERRVAPELSHLRKEIFVPTYWDPVLNLDKPFYEAIDGEPSFRAPDSAEGPAVAYAIPGGSGIITRYEIRTAPDGDWLVRLQSRRLKDLDAGQSSGRQVLDKLAQVPHEKDTCYKFRDI